MKRRLAGVLGVAAVLGMSAAPASAYNTKTQPPGPPTISYNVDSLVIHCQPYFGSSAGAFVVNKNGSRNNCR